MFFHILGNIPNCQTELLCSLCSQLFHHHLHFEDLLFAKKECTEKENNSNTQSKLRGTFAKILSYVMNKVAIIVKITVLFTETSA